MKAISPEEAVKLNQPGVLKEPASLAEDLNLSLEHLIKFGEVRQADVKIFEGFVITLKTLTNEERNTAYTLMTPAEVQEKDPAIRADNLNRAILSYSIEKLNEHDTNSYDSKKLIYEKLKSFQASVINIINLNYERLLLEQIRIITEGVKKN